MKFNNRTGEENINNFGSKMIITEYRGFHDTDIYFPEYNWTFEHGGYDKFKSGGVKCPYERRYQNKGYLGEGEYKVSINGEKTNEFISWKSIIHRCYSEKSLSKNKSYDICDMSDNFLCFQYYAKWYNDNYYEVPGERMHLDKDILMKGNKIYSEDTCIFVPQRINELFVKQQSQRGDLPIGVRYDKRRNHYYASLRVLDEKGNSHNKYLGRYATPEECFQAYKRAKEAYIKQIADEYKPYIPQRLYDAMYNYQVEITD